MTNAADRAVASPSDRRRLDRIGAGLLLLWAGLSIGVAFLATPVKFLAPSLTLAVALDVGQHTFRIYNDVELGSLAALVLGGAWAAGRRRWYLALALPAAVIAVQALWLIPALDVRVAAIQRGQTLPPSSLHIVYIVLEAAKVLWLLGCGFAFMSDRPGDSPGRF